MRMGTLSPHTQFPLQSRGARRSNIVVVVVVVVPVDVDTIVLIGVQREPRDRAALFAQALTDPPPFERLRGSHG